MRLKSFQYSEHEGSPQEWVLEGLTLGAKNLIVGKNASGKSRALNVIAGLAGFLSGVQQMSLSNNYDCLFVHGGVEYRYQLKIENEQVERERLLIDGIEKLDREPGGSGRIWVENIPNVTYMPFKPPPSEVAAFSRRDSIQHSFLEPLFEWASTVRHHQFGTTLGKEALTILQSGAPKVDERNQTTVAALFRQGEKEFGQQFLDAIVADMVIADYHIERAGLCPPVSIRITAVQGLQFEPLVLYVKEVDLPGITDQISMSQGMFRILSLLIQVNYFQLKRTSTCLLIDDIGEGLDFDRSCRVINLLRSKTNNTDLQLVMSTNDRFVMNDVPLEEWSVLQRTGNHVKVRNYLNSREIFEEFKFTGLSNFSFLELDVLSEQAPDETGSHA